MGTLTSWPNLFLEYTRPEVLKPDSPQSLGLAAFRGNSQNRFNAGARRNTPTPWRRQS